MPSNPLLAGAASGLLALMPLALSAQSMDMALPGGLTPADLVPTALAETHDATFDSYNDGMEDVEIGMKPKEGTEGPWYTLRLLIGEEQLAQVQGMFEMADGMADDMGDEADAFFDFDFPEEVACVGAREDNLILCALEGMGFQFSSEDADYETLRAVADTIAPLGLAAAE